MIKGCKTCAYRRLSPPKHTPNCVISQWWCPVINGRIGEGTDKDLEKASGCKDWTDKFNEVWERMNEQN